MKNRAFLLDSTHMDEGTYRSALKRLPEERWLYVDSYEHYRDKYEHLCVYLLAQYALQAAEVSNAGLHFDPNGKPLVSFKDSVYISLSHSNGYCACAVSSDPVGIDIQHHETEWENICRHFYSEEERRYLAYITEAERKKAFFTLWSRKECYRKIFESSDLRSITGLDCPRDYIYYDFQMPNFSMTIMGTSAHCPSRFVIVPLRKCINTALSQKLF